MVGVCASCGAPLTGEGRFCSSCGAAVGAAPREARRVVTALFADVVGSTSLGERLDPEDFKEIVGQIVTRMAEAVAEFGGSVSEYAGDGLLALFGAPVAHEDDPERAVLTGLRIVELTRAVAAEVEAERGIAGLAVRVGIETGLAVLGPVGGGGKVEYGAVGDALNTAARLQAAAEPMGVFVGAQTRRSIEALFDWGETEELSLKGKAEPVLAAPALGRRQGIAGASVGRAPMIGREAELASAGEAVAEALRGTGSILIVSGDAGIGKSRLVAEARTHFTAGNSQLGEPRWLAGRCVSYGDGLPYWPFRTMLRRWLAGASEIAETDMSAALRDETRRLLGEAAVKQAPLLEPLLGIGAEGGVDPEETRRGIQEATRAFVSALAREGPLAISLDDMHWADASSLALAGAILELVETEPLLLVLSARPERDQPFWELRERALRELAHRTREISLEPLPGDTGNGLLRALVGSAELPAELERRVLARAEGNPFYLEELVGSLVDSGALVRDGDGEGWRFDREVPVELPETVEKVILARIDRLSEPAHELLSVAAVLGRQFPVALLQEVAGVPEGSAAALTELERAGLIRDGGRTPAPMLNFKHALIQESVYRSLLKRRRQELHGAALAALRALYPERRGEFLGMLAHHAESAGEDREAFGLHVEAGEAAHSIYSLEEAIGHYDAAMAAAKRLGLGAEEEALRRAAQARGALRYDVGDVEGARLDLEAAIRYAQEAGDDEGEVQTLIALAGLWRILDYERAQEMMEEAARVSERIADPAIQVNALGRLSILYANELRFDRALEAGERALEVAERGGDERDRAVGKDALKLTAQQLGDIDRLDRLTQELLPVVRAGDGADIYLEWTLLESGFVPLARGDFDEALRRIEEALAMVRRRGRVMHEAVFIEALCWANRSRGQLGIAIESGNEGSKLAHSVDSHEWAAWVDATLGWALLDARAAGAAITTLERGLRSAEMARVPAQLARCACLLAWARALSGEVDEALIAAADEHLARVATPGGSAWLYGAHAYSALARAHLAAGSIDRALELTIPIAEASREAGWLEAEAGARLVAGQTHVAGGRADAAREQLDRAAQIAEATPLPAIAWETRASLAGLERSLGRDTQAATHVARARPILGELAASLGDPALQAGLLAAMP